MAPDPLAAFAAALCAAAPSADPASVALRMGLSPAQVIELCNRPDAVRVMLTAAMTAHLVPALPAVVRQVAKRALEGDKSAEAQVLNLVGSASPIKEQLGNDLTQASTAQLEQLARQLVGSLGEFVREKKA
jgi:hypothetical protein